MSKLIAATAGLACASVALATPVDADWIFQGQGFTIPDSNSDGISSTITVDVHAPIGEVWVDLDITHTWVGDLVVTLTGPNGQVVDLINRPGVPASTFGNSSDLGGIYTFRDGSAPIPESGTPTVVPMGTYGPAPESANSFASAYNGSDKFGDWTLTISDNAGGDTGVLNGWTLYINKIPTPGTIALAGLAGLVGIRRRR